MNLQPQEGDKLHKKMETVYGIEPTGEPPLKVFSILYQLISLDACNGTRVHKKIPPPKK